MMQTGGKRDFYLAVIVLVWLILPPGSAWAGFAGGSGTAEDPWRIATPAQLDDIRNYLGRANHDKHFVLVADLDLDVAPYNQEAGWEPIGSEPGHNQFFGHFDGRGHTIRNLFIKRPAASNQGLFGVSKGATIANLALVQVDITGAHHVGALAGRIADDNSRPTLVAQVYVSGRVVGRFDRIGGLAGQNCLSVISDSHAAVDVNGRSYVGGLVGELNPGRVACSSPADDSHLSDDRGGGMPGDRQDNGIVENSYASGEVIGEGDCVGGLVGANGGEVIGSYAIGPVRGGTEVGGLVGRNHGHIGNSYATGSFSGQDKVGGLVGNNLGTITKSYAIGPIFSGISNFGGPPGCGILAATTP